MKYELLALLTDRPDDVDWDVLESAHPAVRWVRDYYERYNSLPTLELFAAECLDSAERPIATAPWKYYVTEAQDIRFVSDATKHLEKFNIAYASDPKRAILALRDSFAKLTEPAQFLAPVDIVAQTQERWERYSKKQAPRLMTGMKPFDDVTGGISSDDEYFVISARAGAGKSFLAHYIALQFAKQGVNVGIYSGEMNEYQVGARIDTWLTHVSNFALTRGKLVDYQTQQAAYASEVKGRILVITPKHLGRNATPSDLRRFVRDHNLTSLFIDQLSLMQPDGRAALQWANHERVAELSLQIKTLQQEQRIPIIAVNQLNRAAVGEDPNLSHLAGSDRVGQDASIAISISRPNAQTASIKPLKLREAPVPDKDWVFTWDIDKGVLSPQLTALDAVRAKEDAAKKADALAKTEPAMASKDDSDADFG